MSTLRPVIAVLAVVGCATAYYVGGFFADEVVAVSTPVQPLATVRGLFVDPRALTQGEVWEVARYSVQLEIRNTTSEPKTITQFRGSCGCASIEPQEMTLPPGGTGTLSVRIDLTRRSQVHAGLARRPFSIRIDPVFDGDSAGTPGWIMTAEVLSHVTLATTEVGFAEGCIHQGEPATRHVRVSTHTQLRSLEAEVVPPNAGTATIEPKGQGQHLLAISPSPTLQPGPFRFTVMIHPKGLDGQSLSPIPIEVSGEMHPIVRAFPRLVLFGEVTTPGIADAEVVLTLPPGDGWRVGQVECDNIGTNVVAVGPRPDGGLRYRITQQVTSPGDQQAVVSFVVRGPAERKERVRVDLRYHGLAR